MHLGFFLEQEFGRYDFLTISFINTELHNLNLT